MDMVLEFLLSLPIKDVMCMLFTVCFFVSLFVLKYMIAKKKGKKYDDIVESMEEAGLDYFYFFS